MESWTLMRFCIYVFLYLSCLEKIDSENLWCLKIKLGPHSLPFSKKKNEHFGFGEKWRK